MMGRWGDGGWGDGEMMGMGRWGDGEMGMGRWGWGDGEMGRWEDGEAARCWEGAKATARVGRCQGDGEGCEAREAELTCKGWSLD